MPDKAPGSARPRRGRYTVRRGALPPSAQVMHFSSTKWEKFIEDACNERKLGSKRYAQVKRLGNSGDAGRDVEARLIPTLTEGQWDLFQAKHYGNRLTPGDAFPELAKFFVNLTAGAFPAPRIYYFCSPQNAGPDLHDLLAAPETLKQRLLSDWAAGLTGLKGWKPKLTPEITKRVQAHDFSKIQECLVRDLLRWHAQNQAMHFELFGIEPERGSDPSMPAIPAADELVYVSELLRVYSEYSGTSVELTNLIVGDFNEHFSDSRATFYCAEGLKRFSRDLYPEDEFGTLLAMVHDGIRPMVSSPRLKSGMERLDRATQAASTLKVSDSKLAPRLRGGDLPGACHHLVNEKKIRWVK